MAGLGEHPAGYHIVNIALQGLSAVLLWRLLERLKIPGAWLAAVVFAVHPVCVNSVARIAEIKNTLSLPFFILSFWLYLRYEALSMTPAVQKTEVGQTWRDYAPLWYGLSLVAFVLALLTKTSTIMLPVLLLGFAAWQRKRITRSDLLQTGPFFILALGFGLMSAWFQKHQALLSTGKILPPESFLERLAIAGHVVWFYLGKALMPVNLNLFYPRWNLDATAFTSFLPVLILCLGLALAWRFRQKWGQPVLLGLGCFIVTLFPCLGFFDSQFMTMWQVSDHLQYLALIAPVTLVIAGFAALMNARIFKYAGAVLILTVAILTCQRAQVFTTEESLYRDTLAKNPAAADAHNDLGVILAKRQDYAGATTHFLAALQSDPDNAGAHSNLGQALALKGQFAEAEPHFLAAIRLVPGDPLAHKRFAQALRQQRRISEAVLQLRLALCLSPTPDIQTRLDLAQIFFQTGNARPAVAEYRRVLSLNPDLPEPLNNLAWLLATAADDTVRNGAEAVQYADHACHLTSFKQSRMISTLAAAYAEAGRFSEAVSMAEMAIQMQTANGETQLAAINGQLLALYRAGMAYHEKPAN